jgi:sulfate permease, SulP family
MADVASSLAPARIRVRLKPRRVFPSLAGGAIAGVLAVVIQISLATLIFSGDLAPYLARGIGLSLWGAVVMGLIVTLTSSVPGAIAIPQENTAAVIAVVAADIAAVLGRSTAPDEIFWTVAAAIGLTSLAAGLLFIALGRFKLSVFIRFVPYPVVGGFLAGTGWLLMEGAIHVMTGAPLHFSSLRHLFQIDVLPLWLPGAAFGIVLLAVVRRFKTFAVVPYMLAAALAVFFVILRATNTSLVDAGTRGWLLGPFSSATMWTSPSAAALAGVHWRAILAQAGGVATILVLGPIALLLNATGLELVIRQDIDLDRELESAGLGNLAAGLFGGPVGYHTLSLSALTHRLDAGGRLVGLAAVATCGAALVFGAALLAVFPRPVLGGFLFFLGLAFLVEWLYDAWFKLPRMDYLVIVVILAAVGTLNFLAGLALGMAAAVVLFVVNYSRIGAVKLALSGANYRSTVDRPHSNRTLLDETGDQVLILRLQGYVFFGTAHTLLAQIRRRADQPQARPLRYVVLDFRLVHGLDSSAVSSFERLKQWGEARGFRVVLTQPPSELRKHLEDAGFGEGPDGVVRFFPTLDHGVEWCENEILTAARAPADGEGETLAAQLARLLPGSVDVAELMAYLEQRRLNPGEYLVRQGDPCDAIYFVESGVLTAQLDLPGGGGARLRTMRGGSVVGEVAMYLGGVRTASVVADSPCTCYRLSAEKLREMEQHTPDLAAALHQFLARLLAERLAGLSRSLEAALR